VPESLSFSPRTPFTGMKVNGKVHRVTLHGEAVYVDGNILIKSGCGKNVSENRPAVPANRYSEQNESRLKRTNAFTLQAEPSLGQREASQVTLSDNQLQIPRIRIDRETTLEQITHATNGFFGLNLVNIETLNDHQKLHDLFNLAHNLRTALVTSKDLTNHLRGKILAEVFYEQSARIQCSFASAMQRLGGSVIYMNESNKENIVDTIRMMSSYSDCLVFKHSDLNAINLAVNYSNVPVINAGGENPTQALFDIFTIREEIGHVNGITITLCGDLKNSLNIHALVKLLTVYKNITIQLVTPFDSYKLPVDLADYLKQNGIKLFEVKTIEEALPTTDVLYVSYMNKKSFKSTDDFKKFQITPTLMRTAPERMIVMHSLPRGDEIHSTFDTDPRAAYLRQAEYSLDVRMALLLSIIKDH
jgi:carbamoyl-phosphate synthase/aspartate carbamoyltransferase/dihydroorotase